MQISASDILTYYRPSRCERRVWLQHQSDADATQADSTKQEQHLREGDAQLERHYLKLLRPVLDLSKGDPLEREAQSLKAVQSQTPIIYKPLFTYQVKLGKYKAEVVAQPDFLIWDGTGYLMQHCRMGKKINRDGHPDMYALSQFHAWVFEKVFEQPPLRMEIYNSASQLIEVPPPLPGDLEKFLTQLLVYKRSSDEPYSPVSWTKCQSCVFQQRCWQKAEAIQDIALLPNLEAALVMAFYKAGILTVPQLLAEYTPEQLTGFEWKESNTPRKLLPERAELILMTARSLVEQRPILISRPEIPQVSHWVMFDLEGVPAQQGHPERAYLWGMMLASANGLENMQLISEYRNNRSDREIWEAFLGQCDEIFHAYGDVPFVHWGSFEPHCIQLYQRRFGDRHGIAKRVRRNLFDFFELLKRSVIIPLPSYSLKVIEKYVGYERPDKEFTGYWSVVSYLRSTNTKNKHRRNRLLQDLLAYNFADLEAMWHVVQWLEKLLEQESADALEARSAEEPAAPDS